jgi:hypothetical protein
MTVIIITFILSIIIRIIKTITIMSVKKAAVVISNYAGLPFRFCDDAVCPPAKYMYLPACKNQHQLRFNHTPSANSAFILAQSILNTYHSSFRCISRSTGVAGDHIVTKCQSRARPGQTLSSSRNCQ